MLDGLVDFIANEHDRDERQAELLAECDKRDTANAAALDESLEQMLNADFALQHNLQALLDTLQRAVENSEEGLRELEQICSSQLQVAQHLTALMPRVERAVTHRHAP